MIDYDKVTVPGIRLLVTQSVFVIKKKTKKIKATLIIYKWPRRSRRGRGAAAIKTKMGGWAGKEPDLDGRVSHPTSLRDGVGAPDRSFFFCRKAKNNGFLMTQKSTFLQSQP